MGEFELPELDRVGGPECVEEVLVGHTGDSAQRVKSGAESAGLGDDRGRAMVYRSSTGGTDRSSGPTYLERGRMSRLSSYCSSTWAIQPLTRLIAKMGV